MARCWSATAAEPLAAAPGVSALLAAAAAAAAVAVAEDEEEEDEEEELETELSRRLRC